MSRCECRWRWTARGLPMGERERGGGHLLLKQTNMDFYSKNLPLLASCYKPPGVSCYQPLVAL